MHSCQESGWRGLVQLAGPSPWGEQLLAYLLQHTKLNPVFVDINVQRLQQGLGTETHCIVINAFQGISPNMLGMVSASLCAGGLLIVQMPRDYAQFSDPDYQRMLGAIDQQEKHSHHFSKRIADFFLHAEHGLVLHENGAESRFYERQAEPPQMPYKEQVQAIQAVEGAARGRAGRPVLITADRGRGKSAALGIACANLLQNTDYKIVVTAIGKPSLRHLFAHLAQELGHEAGNTVYQQGKAEARFYPIDELLQSDIECRLLIVDEAAAIPVKLLQQCIKKYTRVVLATTINGYEGSGKGFELRLLPYLRDVYPQLKQFSLQQPLRWQQNDPLERLINRLLLLDLGGQPANEAKHAPSYNYRCIEQADLAQNEELLQQLFAVLVNAHYQTSPDDLRMMLDHPKVRLFACQDGEEIVAAAMVIEEGGLSQAWQEKLAGGRRPAGHLLPQLLRTEGYPEALDLSCWRIVRIAVQADIRRKGIGQQLLRFIERQCSSDLIGASFALSAEALSFWQAQGYVLCRLGSSREASTGQFSVMVLKAQKEIAEGMLQTAKQHFSQQLPLLLLTQNNDIEAELVPLLLRGQATVLAARDSYLSQEFIAGRRSLEQVFSSVYQLALHIASRYEKASGSEPEAISVLIDKLLLNKAWYHIAQKYQLTGRKAAEALLRQQLSDYFERHEQ